MRAVGNSRSTHLKSSLDTEYLRLPSEETRGSLSSPFTESDRTRCEHLTWSYRDRRSMLCANCKPLTWKFIVETLIALFSSTTGIVCHYR